MANYEQEIKWTTPEQYLTWLEEQYPPGHIIPQYVREEFYNPGSIGCNFYSTPEHIRWVAEARWKVEEMERMFFPTSSRSSELRESADLYRRLSFISIDNIGQNEVAYVDARLVSKPPGRSKEKFGEREVAIIGPFKESCDSRPYTRIADKYGVCWLGGQLFKGLYQVESTLPWYMQIVGGRKNLIKPVLKQIEETSGPLKIVKYY
jgi:hypothetical protein